MLDYAGRPNMVTLGNREQRPMPALQEYLPAIQTRPYDLVGRADVTNAACWQVRIYGRPVWL